MGQFEMVIPTVLPELTRNVRGSACHFTINALSIKMGLQFKFKIVNLINNLRYIYWKIVAFVIKPYKYSISEIIEYLLEQ